ncbi:MAG: hypothetical protein K2K84_08510, partial [Muribaculaceae bacterium]|nr:hypothetical protein [Muribaculaceae bacterium]
YSSAASYVYKRLGRIMHPGLPLTRHGPNDAQTRRGRKILRPYITLTPIPHITLIFIPRIILIPNAL